MWFLDLIAVGELYRRGSSWRLFGPLRDATSRSSYPPENQHLLPWVRAAVVVMSIGVALLATQVALGILGVPGP